VRDSIEERRSEFDLSGCSSLWIVEFCFEVCKGVGERMDLSRPDVASLVSSSLIAPLGSQLSSIRRQMWTLTDRDARCRFCGLVARGVVQSLLREVEKLVPGLVSPLQAV
jgi:hypothetical protein